MTWTDILTLKPQYNGARPFAFFKKIVLRLARAFAIEVHYGKQESHKKLFFFNWTGQKVLILPTMFSYAMAE